MCVSDLLTICYLTVWFSQYDYAHLRVIMNARRAVASVQSPCAAARALVISAGTNPAVVRSGARSRPGAATRDF
jgi:hypothetical protein